MVEIDKFFVFNENWGFGKLNIGSLKRIRPKTALEQLGISFKILYKSLSPLKLHKKA